MAFINAAGTARFGVSLGYDSEMTFTSSSHAVFGDSAREASRLPRRRPSMRWFANLMAMLAALLLSASQAWAASGAGRVDGLTFDSGTRQLHVHGWAAPDRPNVYTSQMRILVGGQQIYRGRIQRLERPDVVAATGRKDWLASGWTIDVSVPVGIPEGRQPVEIHFFLSDGGEFKLDSSPDAQFVDIPARLRPSRLAMALAGLAVFLPLLAFAFADKVPAAIAARASPERIFGGAVLCSFLLLVAVGVTGSSVRLALEGSAIAESDGVAWFGKPREIRSDEWRILTQMAIGQANHVPRFPVSNRNVGIDGNNMLVVGMTGVPVDHPSAVAKPATWGFFLLDLRRALAWHWWFPFFGCFVALWLLLLRVFGLDWRLAAVLALTVPAAPYSVVFSGHPAYMAFFPALGMVSVDALLHERRAHIAALLGALAGLALAGFVLVLYVPWQIGLLYLMLPFAAAVFWERRTDLVWGRAQVIAAVIAFCVAAGVLGNWWWSTRDALATIAATVYPGQRATTVGGDIDPWFLIKGMMSPITMYANSPLMDQSDAGSYVFLLVPLLVAVLLQWVIGRRIDGVSLTLVAFVVWTLTYMFHGFSAKIAELSLWGRATSYRMDLPLGVAQVLLIAWFIRARQGTAGNGWIPWNWIAGTIAVFAVIHSGLMVWRLPVQIGMLLQPSIIVISGLALGAVVYLLVSGRFFVAVSILCVWMVGAALPFNPIGQSPTHVRAPAALLQHLPIQEALDERRIAIIDEHGWTVTAVAVGIPIANTVMYYPQTSLWQRLDPAGAERTLYNRYQHLLFVSTSLPQGAPYRIESQRLDAVRVLIDPNRFDFRMLGVAHILTAHHLALDLGRNPSLQREAANERWSLYRVVR